MMRLICWVLGHRYDTTVTFYSGWHKVSAIGTYCTRCLKFKGNVKKDAPGENRELH